MIKPKLTAAASCTVMKYKWKDIEKQRDKEMAALPTAAPAGPAASAAAPEPAAALRRRVKYSILKMNNFGNFRN